MADGTLAERLMAGDKRALARAITLVESDDPAGWDLVRELYPRTGKAAIVGLTGAPGSGKSTLIGALTKLRREAGRDIAVLSIDPSSPFTQGALLGDRIRLTEHFLDPGVFIRSMANRGALGGLSEAALQAALLMDAAGKDDVFLETVGVGQAEVDIIDHADTIVLVLMPGSGDSIQALKAGVMEIPDIIVVNKADHPLTDTMVREIRGVLSLAPTVKGSWRVPIVKTEAVRGEGVAELVEKLDEHRERIAPRGRCPSAAGATCAARCSRSRPPGCGPSSRTRCARTSASRRCSTRSSRGAWTRRAPRRRSSPGSTRRRRAGRRLGAAARGARQAARAPSAAETRAAVARSSAPSRRAAVAVRRPDGPDNPTAPTAAPLWSVTAAATHRSPSSSSSRSAAQPRARTSPRCSISAATDVTVCGVRRSSARRP